MSTYTVKINFIGGGFVELSATDLKSTRALLERIAKGKSFIVNNCVVCAGNVAYASVLED